MLWLWRVYRAKASESYSLGTLLRKHGNRAERGRKIIPIDATARLVLSRAGASSNS